MVYKRFRVQVAARLVALMGTLLAAVILFNGTGLYATTALVCAFAAGQAWSLIRFVERTNLDLTRFLDAIRFSDFSQSFAKKQGASFDGLAEAFNGVLAEFRKVRADREEHYNFLETITQHVGVGLLSFTPEGKVGLINTAAKRLLSVNHLSELRALAPSNPELVEALRALKPGDRVVEKFAGFPDPVQLVIHATEVRLREQPFILVSLQNIQSELDEKEMDAWQKLIRVLTHEIMNSVTPISSLASTAAGLLDEGRAVGPAGALAATPDPGSELTTDLRDALRTIEKRSRGLLHFVEAYRDMTLIPRPSISIVRIADLFGRVRTLMEPQLAGDGVAFEASVDPPTLELSADPELVEQVLINLVQNAGQALEGRPDGRIGLSARLDRRGRILIVVVDNGPGMSKAAQEKIFVPFYTTKEKGSGIGLSLSRQIMRLHDGAINCRSKEGEGSAFTLRF
jgi:two-component system, NtrC family, nitrogen regulation sensor histidine kinase NtrY